MKPAAASLVLSLIKVEKADLFGYSNGGSIALQVALRHPTLVRKLVVASRCTGATLSPRSSGKA